MGAGQLNVLSCTAGSTGCVARSVHRPNVTSGTAVHTCRGGAAVHPRSRFTKTKAGMPPGTGPSWAARLTGWRPAISSRSGQTPHTADSPVSGRGRSGHRLAV